MPLAQLLPTAQGIGVTAKISSAVGILTLNLLPMGISPAKEASIDELSSNYLLKIIIKRWFENDLTNIKLCNNFLKREEIFTLTP
jgi:hypothetical protein